MRIAFVLVGNVSRSGELTGTKIRYGGTGSSGTESSTIYVAEYLAKMGNEVVIALERCDNITMDNNVTYTNLKFDGVDNKEFDIIIGSLWFSDYKSLPITVTKGVIYWYHLAWGYSISEICEFAKKHNIKVGCLSVSNWALRFNSEYNDMFRHCRGEDIIIDVIPNPVATDIIREVLDLGLERKNHKVVFPGQWSRGGDVAKNVVSEMGWTDSQFKSFDYIDMTRGLDKKTLFKEIVTSDYFIFPQFTHGKLIYKDTFSLSVAESIGLGALVFTYPLGALPEYFGDYCQFVDFPDGVNIDKMNNERMSEEPLMGQTRNFINKINTIESSKHEYENVRNQGMKYIEETFNIERVGNLWINFLNKF